MIRRSDLLLDPIEEDLYNNATTPDDYNALGLNLGDCLEDTDWIVLPDKDPNDPDSWINVNHCDICDHNLPAAQDAAGFPMHHTGEAWEPCHPEDYGLAIVSSYSRYDPICEDHVLDADNLLAPYHGEGERLTINGVDYRPFVIVNPLKQYSPFALLTETSGGHVIGELHEMREGQAEPYHNDTETVETYWNNHPLARLEADCPHTADDWRKLADRLEQLLLPPRPLTPCDDGFIAGPASEFLTHNALTLFSGFGEPLDKPTK